MILPEYVADTHALLWYLQNSPRLGVNASAAFDAADQGLAQIILSSIVIAELYYAIVKHKIALNFAQELARLQSAPQFVFVDFKATNTLLSTNLPRYRKCTTASSQVWL